MTFDSKFWLFDGLPLNFSEKNKKYLIVHMQKYMNYKRG